MELVNSIERLKGLGPKTAEIFQSHGLTKIEDLFYFFPRGWIDATTVRPIAELRPGTSALIEVQVVTVQRGMSQKTRKPYLRALVADASGSLEIIWFYATYLQQTVKPGAQFKLYGKVERRFNQAPVMMSPKFIAHPAVIPVYPEIGGLPSYKTVKLMAQLEPLVDQFPDYLPPTVCAEHNLLPMAQALRQMHYPRRINDIPEAQKRLAFDELLMLMVPSLLARQERAGEQAEAIVMQPQVNNWLRTLPFALTDDQQKVIEEILSDMAETKPMNRLVQGDVGSGKTVVGLAAAYEAILAGKQVVWLAPTELLARQHFATAEKLLGDKLSIGLVTRSHKKVGGVGEEKVALTEVLKQSLIIGTHALLSDTISFTNLGLLIIDEQHRFGVKQRARLRLFGGKPVHLLSMTATPIPRTMALLLYGDLRLSTIKTMPQGRKKVVTRVVTEANRDKAYAYVDQLMSQGYQVYIVCPTIEPTQDEEATIFNQLFETVEEKKSVTTWYAKLKKLFPHRRLAMLHGKLKAQEKDKVMTDFREERIDMLVTTTVIEVGVDVPNANIMVVESAERFGLAQLHQLRGRVGRGEHQAFCFLFPSSDDQVDNARLQLMEQTNDGFELAEKDLSLRGPGEMTGLAQSGIPPLKFASLSDAQQVEKVRAVAQELLTDPQFQTTLQRFWRFHHPE